ncbi:MAG: translation initiation factor [Muribaculaceae bacterium]|nr:translation initiation factor [Muribaculaceae bacterium]
MDWKNVLGSLLENADLPAGEETTPEAIPAKTTALPTLHVLIDRKGRKGKTATIVEGFDPDIPDETERIAALLKRSLGVGGSARGGEILIQGNFVDQVKKILSAQGYKVK